MERTLLARREPYRCCTRIRAPCWECLKQSFFRRHEKPAQLLPCVLRRHRAGEAKLRFDHGAPTPALRSHVQPQVARCAASGFLQYGAPAVCSVPLLLPLWPMVQISLSLQFVSLRRTSEPVPPLVLPPTLPRKLRLRGRGQPVSPNVQRWPVEIVSQAREEVCGECARAFGSCRDSWRPRAISVSWREDMFATRP